MPDSSLRLPLELWGGLESTVNRVGGQFFDQIARSGHDDRPDDLDRFAALGIRTLRYPLLWERIAPERLEDADWTRTDEKLDRLQRLGIRPIAGLVHHGSGPAWTNLLDPGFADGLARYAGAVARRFPWIEDYTPVNEPLTTARFAALYGHWYPHGRDDRGFARALVNECRAVLLAMRAIREVNPAARLVQTEDLGQATSTPTLAYQAEFENHRRWLTFDLLCGRVWREHPLWGYLLAQGITEADLAPFQEYPCPPEVLGINYYVTSERFLDDRIDRYPRRTHGGNGRHQYADVEAVRVLAAGPAGLAILLAQAWDRYQLPLAITEIHLGSTREEQIRWLAEAWAAAEQVRAPGESGGADVRAVTVWALLGSFDWHDLVTSDDGHYEPGVFDLRAPSPRPTALATVARQLAEGRQPAHPVLAVPGWWRRPDRLIYPPVELDGIPAPSAPKTMACPVRPLLLAGGDGPLLAMFAQACARRGIPCTVLDAVAEPLTAIEALEPWTVVLADEYGRTDRPTTPNTSADVSTDPIRRAGVIANACAALGLPLLALSDDLVFPATAARPFVEEDPVAPGGPAGRGAVDREETIRAAHPDALIVRTGPRIGVWTDPDGGSGRRGEGGLARSLRVLRCEDGGVDDAMTVGPILAPDLVDACLEILIDGERGLWHLAHGGPDGTPDSIRIAALVRWAGGTPLHAALAEGAHPVQRPSLGQLGRILGSCRGWLLPTLEHALAR